MDINVEQVRALLALEHAGPVQQVVLNEEHIDKVISAFTAMGASMAQATAAMNKALYRPGKPMVGNWDTGIVKDTLYTANSIDKGIRSKKTMRRKRRK